MSLENRDDRMARVRASMHIAMGAIYLVIGIVIIYMRYFGSMKLSRGAAYSLGALMLIYGAFRIGRGIVQLIRKKEEL